ncbi:helix-turn-helix transcriptional regulator [Clostridioides sp. ZZV14-6105]|uniref:PadR family transcriptional regulator n=1 Tax=Clostridioides sp. ZZV14-6105 TaxID=2811492 RepID=UPI001D1218CA|nr:helix-turn-helix transcriptional regulator [Clostridioides sp. ZZV14-6105]
MDKIILGLLILKKLTIYELRSVIEMNFASMCSNSMGSIQAAIKKLLEKKMIVYEEFVENSVNKKFYVLTDKGKACFLEWVQTSMVAGKVKDMELSKLFFMGFVPTQKRLSLIESYIVGLKKEREQLENIKRQDIDVAKLQYIAYIEENQEQFNHFLQDTEHSNIQRDIKDIIDFELLTLQFGIDRTNFEIAWFENLNKKLINEYLNNSQNQEKGGS